MRHDLKILFIASGNGRHGLSPFIDSQRKSLDNYCDVHLYTVKGKGFIGYLRNLYTLKECIESGKYDLIHAHYGLIGYLSLFVKKNIPMVLSLMGSDVYGSYDVASWGMKNLVVKFCTRKAVRNSNYVIVKSENLLNEIGPIDNVSIVPNGVDFDWYKERDSNYDNLKVLSIVDPNCKRKNYALAVEAFKSVRTRDALLFNPFPVSKKDVVQEIRSSAVVLLTSLNEGSPNIVKEAMACNVPVVSTDVGDVRELFSGATGCYITSFDANDVAISIDKALAFNKNTNGREVLEHLEIDNVAKKIYNIYKKVSQVYET